MKKLKRKSENASRQMKIKTRLSKSMGHRKSSSKREVYSDTYKKQNKKQEKSQINNLTYHIKILEKEK